MDFETGHPGNCESTSLLSINLVGHCPFCFRVVERAEVDTKPQVASTPPVTVISETVVAPLPQLSSLEYRFFELVKSGDVEQVRNFLISDEATNEGIDINKTNKTGYTVLHEAVRRQDEDMVRFLLTQPDIRLYDTLLHAIKEKNVEITKILLEKYDQERSAATGGSAIASQQLLGSSPGSTPTPPKPNVFTSERSGVISTFQMFIPTDPSPPLTPTGSNQNIPITPTVSIQTPPQTPGQTTSPSRKSSPQSPGSKSKTKDDEEDVKVIEEMAFDSAFSSVISPLMMAAQESCYPLMELFYERGERLETEKYPHSESCDCAICAKLEGDQDMTRAYERYHLFKALTEPEYICFIARKEKKDPVNYALQKILKIREIVARDMAFNRLFEDFEKNLEEFVSKLLQLCRNTTETEIFLSPKDAEERLPHLYPRLWYTVGMDLKTFVAQPNAQNLVYKLWATDDWPDWDTYGWIYRSFNIAIRVIAFPLIAIILLVAQDTALGRTLGSPVSRFLTYIGSYIFFMLLVGIQALFPYQRCNDHEPYYAIDDNSCTQRGPPTIGTEWPLVIYILSFYVSMLKRHSVSWYWRMRWNWFEFISQLTFTVTFLCWLWSWIWVRDPSNKDYLIGSKRIMWPNDSAEIFSECFLSLSFLMAGCRLLRFFTVLPELGPIQIALGKQIIDFLSTGVIMMVVIFAFASGMMTLFVPYVECGKGIDLDDHKREKEQEDAFHSPSNAIKTLFFMLYEHGGPDVVKLLTWHAKNDTEGNGVDEHITHKYTQLTAQFLFLTYHVIGVTMLFSMLSGYFAQTVEHVMENVDIEWKYARTELYLTFIKDTVLPPPFNLLPTLKALMGGIKYLGLLGRKDDPKAACSFRQCCYITSSKKTEKWKRLMRGYRKLIVQLIFRYRNLREEEDGEEEATKEDLHDLAEELAEIKALLSRGTVKKDDATVRAIGGGGGGSGTKGGGGSGGSHTGGGGGSGGSGPGGGGGGSGPGGGGSGGSGMGGGGAGGSGTAGAGGGGSNVSGGGKGNSSSATGNKASPPPGTSKSAGGGFTQSGASLGQQSNKKPGTSATSVPQTQSGGKPSESGKMSMLFIAQSALSTPKRSSGRLDLTGSGTTYSMENQNNNHPGSSTCTTCSASRSRPVDLANSQFQSMMPPPEKRSGLMDFSGARDEVVGSGYNQSSGGGYGAREQDFGYHTPPKTMSYFNADVTPKKPAGLVDFTGSSPPVQEADPNDDYRQPRRGSRSGGGLERPPGMKDFSGRGSADNGYKTPPDKTASYTISSEVTPKKPVGLVDFTGVTPPEGNKPSSRPNNKEGLQKSSNQYWNNMDPTPTKSTGIVDFTGSGPTQSRRDPGNGEQSTGQNNFPGYPQYTSQYMPMPDLNEPMNFVDYKEPRKGSRSGGGMERSPGLEDFSGLGNVESAYQPMPTSSNFYSADLPPKKPVGLVDFTGSSPTHGNNQSYAGQNENNTNRVPYPSTSFGTNESHRDYYEPRRGSRSGGGLERTAGLEDFSGLGNVESAYQPIQQSSSYYSAEVTPTKPVGLVDYTGMSLPADNTRSKEGQAKTGQQIEMPMPGTSYPSMRSNPFSGDYKEFRRGSRSGGGLERSPGLEDFSGPGSIESAYGHLQNSTNYLEPELPQKRASGLLDFTGSTTNNNKMTTEMRRGSNQLPPKAYPQGSQHSQGRHQNTKMKLAEAPPPERVFNNVSKMTGDELRNSPIWDSPDTPAEIKYRTTRRNKRDDEIYSPSTSPSLVPSPTKGSSRAVTPIPLRLSDDYDTGVATDGSSKKNYGWRL